ncbi:bifunctional methylenetetrahydrofolate dehydrogenase/cyclohydrolase, mitochondrial [Gracilinanus agilis]|uniref:bifunctional methylenetetrahydrofolate dehydrogenase/cyclohydrolase, mitochondrial n=1 Tax=Gracilinanus agilis TaxID=191870 RepID=UPI001CFDC9C7|nr:bifunctional methylenetetrahydrofolate dehydrogenase/cyclohydrolase, mitochondrial [Gracilinanus agilis]
MEVVAKVAASGGSAGYSCCCCLFIYSVGKLLFGLPEELPPPARGTACHMSGTRDRKEPLSRPASGTHKNPRGSRGESSHEPQGEPLEEGGHCQSWRESDGKELLPGRRGGAAVLSLEQTNSVRNEAVVISGRKLAQQIRQEARHEVEQWVALGNKRPHLSVVLVGEDPASHSYVLNKTKAAADVGISSETILKPASISEEELLDLIGKLNEDDGVDGLLVQLPLPEHIDERRVCNAVAPDKDVDGFHVINVGRLCLDQCAMLPATPWGVWEIIRRTGIPTLGKNVVVAGRSKNVGMPIAMLLHTDGRHERPGGDATVTISHRYTPKEQLKKHTVLADIVVAAAGLATLGSRGKRTFPDNQRILHRDLSWALSLIEIDAEW